MKKSLHVFYQKEWDKWKSLYRHDFRIVLAIFILTSVTSYLSFELFVTQEMANSMMNSVKDLFSEKGMKSDGSNTDAFIGLFFNNAKASIYAVFIGLVPFLFIPYSIPVVNGLLLSIVLFILNLQGKSVIALLTFGILPHGITEIFALCLASTIGIILCRKSVSFIVPSFFISYKEKPFKSLLLESSHTLLGVILPLIFISALIEGYITPRLLDLFM